MNQFILKLMVASAVLPLVLACTPSDWNCAQCGSYSSQTSNDPDDDCIYQGGNCGYREADMAIWCRSGDPTTSKCCKRYFDASRNPACNQIAISVFYHGYCYSDTCIITDEDDPNPEYEYDAETGDQTC
jgi:hypothetical protein